jgi:hypothetical protein
MRVVWVTTGYGSSKKLLQQKEFLSISPMNGFTVIDI